ncbi:hypothetical protein O3P69_005095 [Scylla paramamosain]|uniref:Uncharacterized protein n=1 Tax=Scylla paramamosain TaxID=85552 RepID=A0AAW0UA26_SCYPA
MQRHGGEYWLRAWKLRRSGGSRGSETNRRDEAASPRVRLTEPGRLLRTSRRSAPLPISFRDELFHLHRGGGSGGGGGELRYWCLPSGTKRCTTKAGISMQISKDDFQLSNNCTSTPARMGGGREGGAMGGGGGSSSSSSSVPVSPRNTPTLIPATVANTNWRVYSPYFEYRAG